MEDKVILAESLKDLEYKYEYVFEIIQGELDLKELGQKVEQNSVKGFEEIKYNPDNKCWTLGEYKAKTNGSSL